jgi:hypothetical protein
MGYSVAEHEEAIAELTAFVHERAAFPEGWLSCVSGEQDYQIREHGGKTYYLVQSLCSRQRSREFCQTLGAELATPVNMGEQNFLAGEIFALLETDWWIGANDLETEGDWIDADGRSLDLADWDAKHPGEDDWVDCAVMEDCLDGQWTVEYCSQVYPSICVASDETQ